MSSSGRCAGSIPARLPSASPLRRGLARRHRELLRRLEERMLDGRPVTARGVLLLAAPAARARQPALRRPRRRREPRDRDRSRGARAVSVAPPHVEEALEPKRLRRVLVGRPMRTGQIHETLLPKWLALPIFASDPLSSVAYATESALVVLVGAAGLAAAHLVFPISIGIAVPARDRGPLVPADGARVRDERRRVRRRAREPRHRAEPRRGRRPADGLRAHRRRLDLGRDLSRSRRSSRR